MGSTEQDGNTKDREVTLRVPVRGGPSLDADRQQPGFRPAYPGGGSYVGFAYNVGYARAMLQAALAS